MRLSVWDKPRVIGCAENFPLHIALPRGCLDAIIDLLTDNDITHAIQDERRTGTTLDVSFQGSLRTDQDTAVSALLRHDVGVLCAPTAFGKTVIGASMIANRAQSTLILVHRTELLRQWQERLSTLLDVDVSCVGTLGGGKRKLTGLIDIAVVQSVSRHGVIDPLVEGYGHVIVDEKRTSIIADEVELAYSQKRKVLVLTERTDHLKRIDSALSQRGINALTLQGRMSKKTRATLINELESLAPEAPRILLATGCLVGEGFDHPPLDTLVLAMPISWRGTLQQYAGRLHREHCDKSSVRIIDLVDTGHPALVRMWDKRQRGYRAMGYRITESPIS